jgi:DNA-binding MarR family transcriptional regulator/N-acetylglutamate synthase-like GNAT family acetyltransferase
MSKVEIEQISAVRAFNRFLLTQTGVLSEGVLHTALSLSEARVVFELAHQDNPTATDLCSVLRLDAGYLSRILNKLERQGLIIRTRSLKDGRQRLLKLTAEGHEAFAIIDSQAGYEISEMLSRLSEGGRTRLIEAMHTIEGILEPKAQFTEPFYLRHRETGDIGWVVHQHGVLYKQEYGWDERFEATVVQACADFVQNYDPEKERCWIAEINGEPVGSVFCVMESKEIARLRMLLVAPKARRMGLGTRLVEECIRFAQRAGYQKVTLWSGDALTTAQSIYQKLGFTLVEEEPAHSSCQDMVRQHWDLIL